MVKIHAFTHARMCIHAYALEVARAVHPLEGQQTDANFSTAFDLQRWTFNRYNSICQGKQGQSKDPAHSEEQQDDVRRTFAHAKLSSMANIRHMALTMCVSLMAANADTVAPCIALRALRWANADHPSAQRTDGIIGRRRWPWWITAIVWHWSGRPGCPPSCLLWIIVWTPSCR